ncbi:transcription termination factor Rho [Kribbella antibiotica]|uniref:Transcription termination factor Rho n=1 Tax=Kribbella antibiotica TaxID=190195 RepID=A0A4R4YQQ9_9ACTN|nr:transcription termination factor Rho [Kribbella antibiotica]TDD47483.1 transcription termination factor Rho [Kribbella antibiotica]
MTETVEATGSDAAATTATRRRKVGGGLEGMLLPELKQLAGTLGIKGTGALRKGQLIEAIKAAQPGGSAGGSRAKATQPTLDESTDAPATKSAPAKREGGSRRSRAAAAATADETPVVEAPKTAARKAPVVESAPVAEAPAVQVAAQNGSTAVEARTEPAADREQSREGRDRTQGRDRNQGRDRDRNNQNRDGNRDAGREANRDAGREANRDAPREANRDAGRDANRDAGREQSREANRDAGRDQARQQERVDQGGEEGDSRRRRRRGRDRERNRDGQPVTSGREPGRESSREPGRDSGRDNARNRGRGERFDPEPTISEDDVLVPAAGILDVLDNYAFVRTSGYLPGPNDVYVALSMVKRYGLRKGDAITGAVKQPQEGERKEKFNPLVRIDTVNGSDPEIAKQRQDFNKLTPLYATERLRLETEPGILTTRIVDIVSPIGKGQRGLIVSPPKAGKTMVLQALANAITTNNPEVHLMVVLVDERPEEVTDMQRTVKGEVIASTFDRPADDHTTVAELAIERAKRLVELGHDVVVLLDSITRLGRAYNIAAPASGRILSGGVDSSALYPPKRFFGAARNIEDGGSLTILATALIETGSKMDEVIFEEFKGTGNMELRLRREFADRRIFPAIDVVASGTRREELLMSKEETQVVWKLRRVLSALDGQAALELLIGKLKESKSNIEFLMQVNKTTPSTGSSSTNGD